MDIYSVVIGVAIGIFLSVVWFRKKQQWSTIASTDQQEEYDKGSNTKDLYGLAETLETPMNQTSHPRDSLELLEFKKGVALLSSTGYSVEDLMAYCKGSNWVILCIAVEALCRRKDDQDVSEELLNHIGEIGPWPLFFVLKYLDMKGNKNVSGRLLVQTQEWWVDSSPMKQVVAEYLKSRTQKGETISIVDQLGDSRPEDRENIIEFIRSLKLIECEPLLEEINNWKKKQIDSGYLETIGRIWNANDTEGIVDTRIIQENLALLQPTLLQKPYHSILLVGESGVGKTALVKRIGRNLLQVGWTIFESSATDIIAGQKYIGELEGRLKKMIKALDVDREIIWYIPNFHELIHTGSHRYDPATILDRILPSIEKAEVVVIGETTPEGYERLTQMKKGIRGVFEAFIVNPLSDEDTLALAQKWMEAQSGPNSIDFIDGPTLAEALRLVKQHLTDKTSPGNLLQFLELTLSRLKSVDDKPATVTLNDLLVTLSQLTGLPANIIDDRADLDLGALRTFFQENVLGQQEAVDTLVERVAMLKAGLNDPTRPLGVFLFVGPTGTGKTEIAKKLAEALFGVSDRMIRVDMSEYQSIESLDRILGESTEPKKSNALVNQIRKQPFSVVLLDEFEKAHRNIWDLFLQVFDDGRLTDRAGNLADFRHSIIILTSNLGAKAQSGSGIGFNPMSTTFSRSSVKKAVAQTFRPEFVNRIDRIVIFHPLSRNVMRKILRNELNAVLQRRGLRNRDWAVEWEESAIGFLLNKGFTPDMGARPLKRTIEQYLLSPLAITIVEHDFPEGDQFLFVSSNGDQLNVEFIDLDVSAEGEKEKIEAIGGAVSGSKVVNDELQLKMIAFAPQGDLGELQFLQGYMERLKMLIQAEEWVNKKNSVLRRMSESGFWDMPDRFGVLTEIEVMDRIESGLQSVCSLSGRLIGRKIEATSSYSSNMLQRLAEQLYLLDKAYTDFLSGRPHDAFLLVEASVKSEKDRLKSREFFMQIWGMYRKWAQKRKMQSSVLVEKLDGEDSFKAILEVSGFGAYTLLENEKGRHVLEDLKDHKTTVQCTLLVNVVPQQDMDGADRYDLLSQAKEAFNTVEARQEIIRRYRFEPSPLVRDNVKQWRTGHLDRVLEGDFDLIV